LTSSFDGFPCLYAALYFSPGQRKKLETLCRYIARPAVAEERLELFPAGDIRLQLKTPYNLGMRTLLTDPRAEREM